MNWQEELRRKGEEYRESARHGRVYPHHTGIGPGGLNICKTPGMKIRSGGKGRGLSRGGGRGPIGIPYKEKSN